MSTSNRPLQSRRQAVQTGEDDYNSDDGAENIKATLETSLSEVKTAGSFATSGQCLNACFPGLCVEGVGLVGLPLTEHTAGAIIAICHQAPYGKGSETVVNESVRKTWELNPDRFEFLNPEWQPSMQKVASSAAQQLGLAEGVSVKAELYKLLLYEEVAMFKAHQDTEKSNGMFGTLVISLPSKHEGGDIIACHHGETNRIVTAAGSAYRMSYIAWYADVIHEVQPVTSGYRLVIVYNLVQTSPGPMPTAAHLLHEKNAMRQTLAAWHRGIKKGNRTAPRFLVYQLDHEYTEASLGLDSLKGLDKARADFLMEVCAQTSVGFYLASSEKKESGGCEDGEYGCSDGQSGFHPIEEVVDSSLELKRMVDLDGTLLAESLSLAEDDFIQEDAFERDPDRENYEGYMGNWGLDVTHIYNDLVFVLVPFTSRSTWLKSEVCKQHVDINNWIQQAYSRVSDRAETPQNLQEDLYLLAKLAIGCPVPSQLPERRWCVDNCRSFPAVDAQWPIKAAIVLDRQDLFEECLRTQLPIPFQNFRDIGKGMWQFNLDTDHARPGFRALLNRRQIFCETVKATLHLLSGFKHSIPAGPGNDVKRLADLRDWTIYYLCGKIELGQPVSRDDGSIIAKMFKSYGNDLSLTKVITMMKRDYSKLDMLVAFIVQLRIDHTETSLAEKGAKSDFDSLVEAICSRFSVQCQQTGTKRDHSGDETSPNECLSNADDIALFLHQLASRGKWDLHVTLLNRLTASLDLVPDTALHTFYMSLLTKLATQLQPHPESIPPYREFFSRTLQVYRFQYIQPKPSGGDWSCSPEGCGRGHCADCQKLDTFFLDPQKAVERFSVSKNRRQHLHQCLNSAGHSHETDRSTYPETLVVKKAESKSHKAYKAWKARVVEAEKLLGAMGQDMLKELLREQYTELIDLRSIRKTSTGNQRAGGSSRSKAEIIDLT